MRLKKSNVLHNVSEQISVEEFMKEERTHQFSTQYENNKNKLLDIISRKDHMKKMQKRKILVAAAAGALVFGVPASVFAAKQIMAGLQVNKQQTNNYQYEYSFSDTQDQSAQESPLFHSVVKLQYGYLPDGYKEIQTASNKFDLNGDTHYNQGISVLILTLDKDQKITVDNAVSSKDLKVGDMDATLFYKNTTSDNDFDKDMIIFFNEYGYGVEIYAQVGMSEEEMMKVANGIQLVPCDRSEADATGEIPKKSAQKISAPKKVTYDTLDTSQMLGLGNEFKLNKQMDYSSSDLAFTVENMDIRDSIAGLTDKGFGFDLQDVKNLVNSDGTLHSYIHKNIIQGDRTNTVDQVVSEEERQIKLVYVTMKVKNTSTEDVSGIKITPQICCLKNDDGQLKVPNIYSAECIQEEGWAVYCDQPTMYDMDPQTYSSKMNYGQRYLIPAGAEMEYHVAFIVDADKTNNMVLFFNPGGTIGAKVTDQSGQAFGQAIIKLY